MLFGVAVHPLHPEFVETTTGSLVQVKNKQNVVFHTCFFSEFGTLLFSTGDCTNVMAIIDYISAIYGHAPALLTRMKKDHKG